MDVKSDTFAPLRNVFNINRAIHAPFDGLDEMQIERKVTEFIQHTRLDDYKHYFMKAAFLAQSDEAFDGNHGDGPLGLFLSNEEEICLLEEKTNRWKQPQALWQLVALCAIGAITQGWDEAAVDGAQVFYQYAFGLKYTTNNNANPPMFRLNETLMGLVNSAPYLCSAFSCWLTQPLNDVLGRRGTIFLACIFSASFCLGQAFSWNWQIMFTFRFLLGLGMGPKSATIPIYASECAPANVRGALVMMWQIFTAFGIMCGYICGAALRGVLNGGDDRVCQPPEAPGPSPHLLGLNCSLNWRLMVASPMVAPILLAMYIFTQPESPRWLLAKAHKADKAGKSAKSEKYYSRVFRSLTSLRHSKLQAARDMMLIHYRLRKEDELRTVNKTSWYKGGIYELFSVGRNRRAVIASLIVMFMQQFCGINILIYYSTTVLLDGGYGNSALLWSMGVGILNFTFALPAFKTIDTFGRRSLLLVTFPFLAIFQLLNAIAFRPSTWNSKTQTTNNSTPLAIAGLYLFAIAYSPGEGPVPFLYSAESMPLYIRDLGMGLATSTLWLFSFVISISWPSFRKSYTPFGAFLWYSVWCVIGWFLIFFFVPETKGLELEELDAVFETPTWVSASFYWREGKWWVRRYILHQRGYPKPKLQRSVEEEVEMGPMRRRTTHHTIPD